MIETVVALLMIINGEIKEARIQTSISECLKGSRIAKRNLKPNSKLPNISVTPQTCEVFSIGNFFIFINILKSKKLRGF